MGIDLYYLALSPPCRSILMLAKHLNLPLNLKPMDLLKNKDHLKPEYLAINPAHTVPTIVDHDTKLTLWESRAIMGYLVDKYAPDNSMYPQDPVRRAVVNKWLYFDSGSLINACRPVHRPVLFGQPPASSEAVNHLKDTLKLMDTMLAHEKTEFAAGNNLTIADLALVTSFDMPVYLTSLDLTEYKTLIDWYSRVKKHAPGYKEFCEDVMLDFKSKLNR